LPPFCPVVAGVADPGLETRACANKIRAPHIVAGIGDAGIQAFRVRSMISDPATESHSIDPRLVDSEICYMSADPPSDFDLEIAHVLFMDIVGYSKAPD